MNKVVLIGNIAKDLELKQTQNGKNYLKFTLAVRRDKDNADFITCVAWDKTAELITQYHKKGDPIGVVGSIQTGSYDGQNGKVYTTDVLVKEIEFVKKSESKPQPRYEEQNIIDAPRVEMPTHKDIDISADALPFY